MYICICKQITDKQIIEEVDNGASFFDLQKKLGVGLSCGSCLDCVVELVAEYSVPVGRIKIINTGLSSPEQPHKNI